MCRRHRWGARSRGGVAPSLCARTPRPAARPSPAAYGRSWRTDRDQAWRRRLARRAAWLSLSERVNRPFVRELDRASEGGRGLLAGPLGIELVREVSDHEMLGAGTTAVLAGLGRGEMPAFAGSLGTGQRRLDHQQVGAPGEVDQLIVGTAVGAVGEAPALLVAQLDREGGCVMG